MPDQPLQRRERVRAPGVAVPANRTPAGGIRTGELQPPRHLRLPDAAPPHLAVNQRFGDVERGHIPARRASARVRLLAAGDEAERGRPSKIGQGDARRALVLLLFRFQLRGIRHYHQ